jgi:type IV secretory pathway VirB3-like protein
MTDDDAIADRLLLPCCRPVLFCAVPYRVFWSICFSWGFGLIWFGAAVTGSGVAFMAWLAARAMVAHDFNAFSVIFVYCKTKLFTERSLIWISGVTLDPLYGQRKPR